MSENRQGVKAYELAQQLDNALAEIERLRGELRVARDMQDGETCTAKRVHHVKVEPVYMDALIQGRKTFEYRYNDRDYQAGDRLIVQEWDKDNQRFLERVLHFKVTHVLTHQAFYNVPVGWVILSIKPIDMSKDRRYAPESDRYVPSLKEAKPYPELPPSG